MGYKRVDNSGTIFIIAVLATTILLLMGVSTLVAGIFLLGFLWWGSSMDIKEEKKINKDKENNE